MPANTACMCFKPSHCLCQSPHTISLSLFINKVECRSLEEAHEAALAGADIVMLDNFEPEQLKETAKTLKDAYPHLIIEASGGITLSTMHNYFSPYVDVISRGNLTQGYACMDYSLKINHGPNVVSMYAAVDKLSDKVEAINVE